MAKSPLRKAIDVAGSQTALASLIGKTQGHISKWLQRDYVPPESVLDIERATGISRHELRPDIYPAEAEGFAEERGQFIGTPGLTGADLATMKPYWTVAEIDALDDQGKLAHDRWELVEGEITVMMQKGIRHELLKTNLNIYWAKRLPEEYTFATETTFRFTTDTFLEPDFVFYRRDDGLQSLRSATAQLIVEISGRSLGYDMGSKAGLYAKFGIKEFWVINAKTHVTTIHRELQGGVYTSKVQIPENRILSPLFCPELAVTLSKLELF